MKMKKMILPIIAAIVLLLACVKEEKDVCKVCTQYNSADQIIDVMDTVCLPSGQMQGYENDLYNYNDAQHHYECEKAK
jgi:hypothetical protein